MRFDVKERRSGKTTRMIQWLLDGSEYEHRVLVVHSYTEQQRLEHILSEYDIDQSSVSVTTVPNLTKFRGRKDVVLGIDNLELVMGQLLGYSVDRVTATGEMARV